MYLSRMSAILILSAVTTVRGRCPSGPSSVNTTSGGFEFTYPWPIQYQELLTQQQSLCQAYMDVHPDPSISPIPVGTVVLLHGKNFCGATWERTARVLLSSGYRVIIPDHIGFCKSSKPAAYQYSLQQLALNVHSILSSLNSTAPLTVIGHSLGVSRLVLVNPIGLEDWKAKGVPYQSTDQIYLGERASNYTSIRGYEQSTYYLGTWTPAYDVWVDMLVRIYRGPEAEPYAFDQALITDAVYTQPIVYELPLLTKTKVLLLIGAKDTTAIGKAWAPPDVQRILGNYSVLGKEAASAIGTNATLVEFEDLGHAPQIQAPERFHKALMDWLA